MVNRKETWVICKQIWYIPFIWSLAWFSYWIGYNLFIYKLSLTQIDSLYFYGLTISVAFLFVAGYISGKKNNKTTFKKNSEIAPRPEKEFQLRLPPDKWGHQKQSITEEPEPVIGTNEEKPVHPTPPIIRDSLMEKSKVHRSYRLHTKPADITTASGSSSGPVKSPDQTCKHQEAPSDCMVCPNLLNCPQRMIRIAHPGTPCPLEKETNKDSFESSGDD